MISQFHIGNFKAFGESPQAVPLKPLTIIFGPNSSGKSTILHSLLFAHHAARTGDLDVVYPELAEETVDLGGFRQFVHGAQRGIENRLDWAADCSALSLAAHLDAKRTELNRQLGGPESTDWRTQMADLSTLEIALEVGIPRDDKGRPIASALPQVQRMECLADRQMILSGFSIDGQNLQIDQVASEHPLINRMTSTLAAAETFALEISDAMRGRISKEIDSLVADLQLETDGFLPRKLYDVQAKRRSVTESETRRPDLGSAESVAKAVRRSLPRMLDELLVGIADLIRKDLFTTRYLGPLRSYPPRHIAFAEAKDLGSRAGGGHAWLEVARDESVRNKVNGWLSDAGKLKTPYQLMLQRHFPQQAFAAAAERSFEQIVRTKFESLAGEGALGTWLQKAWAELGERRGSDPEQGPTEMVEQLTDLLTEGADKVFDGALREDEPSAPADIMLMDMRTRTTVSHRDVGIGISQVLPVLVNAYGAKNQILAIEQPEIHLHPALQSELGDVFIESALGENRNRCILETHSEHLILRILRRIRETTGKKLPEGAPAITPDDVALLYVDVNRAGAEVLRLRADKHGRLIDPCPGGFFEEDFNELF